MTIAIPLWQERVSPVLDTATRLLVVTRRQGREIRRTEFVLAPATAESTARSVAELNVDVLLCAALSERLCQALKKRGVRVRPHLCGPVEEVLHAFCCRQLQREEFRMPGCWGPKSCRHQPRTTEANVRAGRRKETSRST